MSVEGPGRPVRIMIVDDSAVIRGLLSRWIGEVPGLEVVAMAADGRAALDLVRASAPDIVLLDLEMSGLDGLATLPLLLAARPALSVVVVSSLTERGAEISVRCLRLGAVDCIPKPSGARGAALATAFRAELLAKLRGLAPRHPAPAAGEGPRTGSGPAGLGPGPVPARILAIGASTGGPRAAISLLRDLGEAARGLPILVVQHMPPIFTSVFAQQIAAACGIPASEARDGAPLVAGEALVAPGGRHLGLDRSGGAVLARLDDSPPLHHCRPAVDLLLRDVASIYGRAALAVILTGMGTDGLEGSRALVRAGGTVLVQDEASSVVWGMPGSVARAGLAAAVLSLDELPAAIEARATRGLAPPTAAGASP